MYRLDSEKVTPMKASEEAEATSMETIPATFFWKSKVTDEGPLKTAGRTSLALARDAGVVTEPFTPITAGGIKVLEGGAYMYSA